MSGFDIASLYDFNPPEYLCRKCFALWTIPQILNMGGKYICPTCKVNYVSTTELRSITQYLDWEGNHLKFPDIMEHCQELATIARDIRNLRETYPPLRGLFAALEKAKNFVHFTTYKISHMMIGALKMAAQRVLVRGVVSGVDADTANELTAHKYEAPFMNIKIYGAETEWKDMPHQKLVVIDGLLAFKGSANLTLSGWRKAAKDRDEVEVVTDVDEVITRHNRFFSPVWAELSDIGDTITMEKAAPF